MNILNSFLFLSLSFSLNFAQAQYQDLFKQAADPVKTNLELHPGITTKIFIAAKTGGTIKLVDPSGNSYVLTIPADAIDFGTEISMTLIKNLGADTQAPADSTFGVQLEPSGLEFKKTAWLTITPKQQNLLQNGSPFSYRNSGENLILTFGESTGQGFKIPVEHFSGYGVVNSGAFRINTAKHLAELMSDRLSNVLTHEILKLQQDPNYQMPKDFAKDLAEKFFKEVIEPSMNLVNSCSQGEKVMTQFFQVIRIMALSGFESESQEFDNNHKADFNKAFSTRAQHCLKETGEPCVSHHLYMGFLQTEWGILRQCQLLGMDCESFEFYKDLKNWEKRCLNFEARFKHELLQKENPGPNFKIDIKLPYRVSFVDVVPASTAAYEATVDSFASGTDSGLKCSLKSQKQTAGIFTLNYVDLFKFRADLDGRNSIWIDIGSPLTQAIGSCVDETDPQATKFNLSLPPTGPDKFYPGLFQAAHTSEMEMNTGLFRFKDVTVDFNNIVILKRHHQVDSPDIMMSEIFDFQLVHDPK